LEIIKLFKKAFRSAGDAIDEASADLSRAETWMLRHSVFEREITYAAFEKAIGPIT